MNSNPIIIIWGEPNSVFSEILIKSLKIYKSKKPIVLIGSSELLTKQIKKLKIKFNSKIMNLINDDLKGLKKNKINLIDVHYKFNNPFEEISSKSNKYILKCFEKAYKIIKKNKISGLINGPVSKKYFLKSNYLGITEFLSHRFKIRDNYAMLIYNKALAVSPITTHFPIEKVSKKITKKLIITKLILINKFYRNFFSFKPKIAVCGLNPHCENFFKKKSEEAKVIIPAINYLKKKKLNIKGPFAADTIFLKNLRDKYDVVVGMYHDQVLTPIKTIYGFNAINITIGLPFVRISPDHGPNFSMIGKNRSNPQSLINSIQFLNRIN
ncbi:4-hydroxythreonine-4-phosphate dehydrogenase PdxA [Candidatus Pelagibacter sp.]|nr:4-hydroxythreonine-4-phosphate dehydrogenase PdxA [Candidatus Pelagibacter sp.]